MGIYYLSTNGGVSYVFKNDYTPHESVRYFNEPPKLEIKLALPGVKKEDLEFKFEKNYLTVTYNGESKFVDKFERSFSLKDYDFNTLKKELINGVLTLELEKSSEARPVIFKLE